MNIDLSQIFYMLYLLNLIANFTGWASIDPNNCSLDGTLQWWPLNGEKTSPQQNTQQQQLQQQNTQQPQQSLKTQGKCPTIGPKHL